ncbi:hypothetical protein AMATHDRAFT_3316 [Amanita thiersii Skay4041]|uniref:Amino acid permease/ SLC12A domain-containing protein n=1 Tax=Amanita thiersii Skay4041 TaxID=703135 RepID=A0A2A9NJM3_9AGAR|nr:hypothetical protein AMATHDRAFT_3316 [Amanita thiersii Skay4041]
MASTPKALLALENEENGVEHVQKRWIAVRPPLQTGGPSVLRALDVDSVQSLGPSPPPSFQQARFAVILRRQRLPTDRTSIKYHANIPSRFINLSNAFEFAGWGSLTRIQLTEADYDAGRRGRELVEKEKVLGQFTACALAGNAVLGSVFYALPAVVAVAGIYSPISLFISTLVLFLWRPIMEELASALPISGAPYSYLLNVSTKSVALIGASLLLLDFSSTSVVSASTAVTYLAGEVDHLPFPPWVGAVLLLVAFTIVSLTGVKESARIALAVLSFHLGTMAALIIAAIIRWRIIGFDQLRQNWSRTSTDTTRDIVRQVYYGICLGMLGLTGFECIPAYIARIKPGQFPPVLRNLHLPAVLLNTSLILLLLAIIPLEKIQEGANVLSLLAEVSTGRWLRIWIVVDAIIVLSGGVLTGILSACELFHQLAQHRILPRIFLKTLPRTDSPYISILSFSTFSGMIYASASASLSVVSQMFSLVWLTVMLLFPLSLLLLRFNRGRLPRVKQCHLMVVFLSLVISFAVFTGNVAVNPITAGYFSAYFVGVVILFSVTQNKIRLLRCVYWLYDQHPILHDSCFTSGWGGILISMMKHLKRRPLCILTKTDEINHLFQMISYVQKNEETSCLKIVHFHEEEDGIPSELEANAKILDEAFPEITIDLILVQGRFNPESLSALAHHMNIPTSLMFMGCPGRSFQYSVAEMGTRVILL